MDFTLNNGGCCMSKSGCNRTSNHMLSTFDWLNDIPEAQQETDLVEVQFKNTRKAYYLNNLQIPLEKGDIVAVEASPGHDIGEVTLTGKLVALQIKKNNFNPDKGELRKIYRKAKDTDVEKFNEAKSRETQTMIQARQIAKNLSLDMKIGDVEYQGDGNKAIFYYIADERVDFRQLIKVFAETFRIRIEMKQIGARQEAGRIGGIGPCGRELCCSGWMTNFNSVSTGSARVQDISMNPQKLAGQCGKLKCCLNFELDTYQDALKEFPSREINLETSDSTYYHFKTDTFNGLMTYSTAPNFGANLVTITAERAKDIIKLNRKGMKPDILDPKSKEEKPKAMGFDNVVGEDDLTRFDSKKGGGKQAKKKGGNPNSDHRNGKPEIRNAGSENRSGRPDGRQGRPDGGNSRPEGQNRRNNQNAERPANFEIKNKNTANKAENKPVRPKGGEGEGSAN